MWPTKKMKELGFSIKLEITLKLQLQLSLWINKL